MPSPVIALDLLNSAAQLAGITALGESLTSDEANLGLTVLNDLLEEWNLQNFAIYSHSFQTFNLVANTGTYTIGTGQTFNTTRPVSIKTAYATINSVDYPILVIGDAEYSDIWLKSLTGAYPAVLNYSQAWPTGSITFWPIPATNMTVTLGLDIPFSQANLATSLSYPPGYAKAFRYILACELCAAFQLPVPPAIEKIANDVMGDIKVANLPDDVLEFGIEYRSPMIGSGSPRWVQ